MSPLTKACKSKFGEEPYYPVSAKITGGITDTRLGALCLSTVLRDRNADPVQHHPDVPLSH